MLLMKKDVLIDLQQPDGNWFNKNKKWWVG